jgi:predicted kinase
VGFSNNDNQRPVLFAFCGLPGSGKTTIAKEVEKTTGAVRLNVDEWVAALGADFWDDAFRHKLHVRLYEHGITLLKRGQSIIVEDGLWTRDERDSYREVARKLGAAIELHYFDLAFDELWRRLEARNALGAYDTVPITKELLKICWPKLQRPDEAELALFDRYVVYT